ncbi:MAG: SIMPL domain-containing protein, partial [Candidatus Krumholzibacteriota bacterium]
LKTTSFDVSVDHEYEKQTEKNVFNGYLAQHEMKIEIPMDKEKSNSLIEKMTTGVTDLEFTIYFTVSNPEELHNEMLKKAIENATGRAEVIADAAGVKLGKISSISYSWNEIRFRSRFSPDFGISKMACMDEMAVPDFQPESIKESANVDISWGLIV